MSWTVVWLQSAQNHLAELWLNAEDRSTLAEASNALDDMLRQNPKALGESRSGSNRVAFLPPLGISYDVLEEDCMVKVLAVWRI